MSYLKAYQAYSADKFTQCLNLLKDLPPDDTKTLDLKAQVHFKKKQYQDAYDIYQTLIGRGGEFTQERKNNVQAIIICSQLEQPGKIRLIGEDRLPSSSDIVEQVEVMNLKDGGVYDLLSGHDTKKRRRERGERKRKQRLPKNYDPVAGPDPQRWIARRDRTNVRNKKRRNRPTKFK